MDTLQELENALDSLDVSTETQEETNKKIEEASKELGMEIHNEDKDEEKKHEIFYELTEMDRDQAVYEGLVPESYRDAQFSVEKIKSNLRKHRSKTTGFTVRNFGKYIDTCIGILSAIRLGKLPRRSYLIGASNGFGKTSFVDECIITLRKYDFDVVPYKSLLEIAELRKKYEDELSGVIKQEDPSSNIVSKLSNTGKIIRVKSYKFLDFVNASCLFTYFSSVVSKEIESQTLEQLLRMRGVKGLPTIVMIESSIDLYKKDNGFVGRIFDSILDSNEKLNRFDSLYHLSAFSYTKTDASIGEGDSNVESDTGIVKGE